MLWTHSALILVAGLAYVQSQTSIVSTMCPALGVSFSLDGSGSLCWNAGSSCQQAEKAVEDFVLEMLTYMGSGPKAAESKTCGNAFGNGVWNLWDCTGSFTQAKSTFQSAYDIGGSKSWATNMYKGVQASKTQLDGLKSSFPDLARVMFVVSDGEPNPSSEATNSVSLCQTMKADDVTVFSVGFAGAAKQVMLDMAGSKTVDPCDFCSTKTSSIQQLTSTLATGFCTTIVTLLPPTPAPTLPPCASTNKADTAANKDVQWNGCVGGLCANYPWGNGSNQACVWYRDQADACSSVTQYCGCSCYRCCDTPAPTAAPTPFPTPAPGEPTQSPTPAPTAQPTIKLPDQPAFIFDFQTLQDWEAAEAILKQWFGQLGYDFDAEWATMVQEYRVKVVKGSTVSRFDIGNIFTVPFEDFKMQVWMPDKFYQTTTGLTLGADRIASALMVPLFGLLLHTITATYM